MAIGNPVQKGTNTSQLAVTTLTSSSCVIPAASLVVVCLINSNGATAPGDASAVAFTGGGVTFQKDKSNAGQSNVGNVQVWSGYDTTGRTDTVVATFPSSNMSYIYVFTIASAATTSWLDTSGATNTSASGTAAGNMAVVTAANVAQADSVAIGLYGQGTTDTANTTWPGAGATSLVDVVNTTRHLRINVEYINGLTAGATATTTGTTGVSNNLGRVIVVYKGAAAAAATVTPPRPTVVLQAVNRSYTI